MEVGLLENAEIWKQVLGSEVLFEFYGYFPTFHDAVVERMDLNLERREFVLTVVYTDLFEIAEINRRSRISMLWTNVQNARFSWYSEDLYGLAFSRSGECIKTTFEYYPAGFYGELVSGEIRLLEIEAEPERTEAERGTISLKFQ